MTIWATLYRSQAAVGEEALARLDEQRQLLRVQRRRRRAVVLAEAAGGLDQAGEGDARGELQHPARGVPAEPAAVPRQPTHDVGAVFQELRPVSE